MLAGPIADPLPNWVTELSNVSAQQRWVLLTNLKAATSYQFRVSAVNSVGEGSPSEPSNVVSLPQEGMVERILYRSTFLGNLFSCIASICFSLPAPSGPPVGFIGTARSPSEIITQWQPPLEEHRNGQILGYVIRYRLYGYIESPWTSRNITNEV